jgi:uncharacterized beta-barrel protein YwiB (DUF1934 family)
MKDVIVTVIGTQQGPDGDQNTIELIANGHCRQKGEITYITYKEELSGLEGTTTLLKLYSDHVTLVRMGRYEQKQEFIPGRKTYSRYVTPYGSMKLGVLTRDLARDIANAENPVDGQTILISYELDVEGKWQSSNTLKISFIKA